MARTARVLHKDHPTATLLQQQSMTRRVRALTDVIPLNDRPPVHNLALNHFHQLWVHTARALSPVFPLLCPWRAAGVPRPSTGVGNPCGCWGYTSGSPGCYSGCARTRDSRLRGCPLLAIGGLLACSLVMRREDSGVAGDGISSRFAGSETEPACVQ